MSCPTSDLADRVRFPGDRHRHATELFRPRRVRQICAGSQEFLTDAETIRTKILSAYELAEPTDDESERARQMTFVLVGGGPTGVELAASMAQMATVTLRGNFRRIDPAKSSIILLEGGNRILPTFAEIVVEEGRPTA